MKKDHMNAFGCGTAEVILPVCSSTLKMPDRRLCKTRDFIIRTKSKHRNDNPTALAELFE